MAFYSARIACIVIHISNYLLILTFGYPQPDNVIQLSSHRECRCCKFIITLTTKETYTSTLVAKPVLRGHLWTRNEMIFKDRCPLKRGPMHMAFTMTEQESVNILTVLLDSGDSMEWFTTA